MTWGYSRACMCVCVYTGVSTWVERVWVKEWDAWGVLINSSPFVESNRSAKKRAMCIPFYILHSLQWLTSFYGLKNTECPFDSRENGFLESSPLQMEIRTTWVQSVKIPPSFCPPLPLKNNGNFKKKMDPSRNGFHYGGCRCAKKTNKKKKQEDHCELVREPACLDKKK